MMKLTSDQAYINHSCTPPHFFWVPEKLHRVKAVCKKYGYPQIGELKANFLSLLPNFSNSQNLYNNHIS